MSMRSLVLWLASALAGCVVPVRTVDLRQDEAAPGGELTTRGRQLNFGAGQRSYEDEDFGALDDQFALALDYCEPMGLGPLRLEGGMHYSWDEATVTSGGQQTHLDAWTFELLVGANLSHQIGRFRPYVGAGAALLFLDVRGVDDDVDFLFDDGEGTIGGYVKAGLLFQVRPGSHLGLELRHFEGGDVELDGTELDSSHDELLIVFGTSFE